MGTDQSSDGVTFMRVIEVLHTLIRSPEGAAVSNVSMCEVMLSCFKISFEPRLSELLRRSAEKSLKDMVLLFFMRLPQFAEERSDTMLQKRFTIGDAASGATQEKLKRKTVAQAQTAPRKSSAVEEPPQTPQSANLTVPGHLKAPILATTPASPAGNILDMQGKITQTPTTTASTGKMKPLSRRLLLFKWSRLNRSPCWTAKRVKQPAPWPRQIVASTSTRWASVLHSSPPITM